MSADPSLRRAGRGSRPRRLSLVIALLLFLGVVGAGAWARQPLPDVPGSRAGPEAAGRVHRGTGHALRSEVMEALHDRGVIPCGGFVGNLLLRGTGKADRIRTGSFELTTGMTLEAALEVLTTPPPEVPTVELVIPEGFRLTQIAEQVQEDLGIPAKRFLKEAQSGRYVLPPYLPAGTGVARGVPVPEELRVRRGRV